jgi:hypothetical protein
VRTDHASAEDLAVAVAVGFGGATSGLACRHDDKRYSAVGDQSSSRACDTA